MATLPSCKEPLNAKCGYWAKEGARLMPKVNLIFKKAGGLSCLPRFLFASSGGHSPQLLLPFQKAMASAPGGIKTEDGGVRTLVFDKS